MSVQLTKLEMHSYWQSVFRDAADVWPHQLDLRMGPSTAMRVTVKPKSSTLPLSHQRTVSNCRSSHVNLDAIFQFRFAGFSGAVDAAENLSVGFNTDRKSTRLNSSHRTISYAVFCLKK